jgi:hypothetical protein
LASGAVIRFRVPRFHGCARSRGQARPA